MQEESSCSNNTLNFWLSNLRPCWRRSRNGKRVDEKARSNIRFQRNRTTQRLQEAENHWNEIAEQRLKGWRVECRVRVQIKRKHFSSIRGSSRYRGAMVFAAKESPSETITTREVRPSIPNGEHEHSLPLPLSSISLASVIYRPDKPFHAVKCVGLT